MSKKKRTITIVIVAILLVIVIGATAAFSIVDDWINRMQPAGPDDPNTTDEEYDLSLTPVDGFINILVLGVDTRDMSTIVRSRSDVILIASINEETKDITLTSVYRDTYLKHADGELYDKINHACYYGGPERVIKTLNQCLDLDIQNYVVVNFKAVVDVVDALGGITVNVEEKQIEGLNKYAKQTANNIGLEGYDKTITTTGVQTLDGCQTVAYGRIRKGVGDDMGRQSRVREVASHIFAKVKHMNLKQIKALSDLVIPQVQTNLNTKDIIALGLSAKDYNIQTGSGFPYAIDAKYFNALAYIFPTDFAGSVEKLHREVFGQEDYVASEYIKAISEQIYQDYLKGTDDIESWYPKEDPPQDPAGGSELPVWEGEPDSGVDVEEFQQGTEDGAGTGETTPDEQGQTEEPADSEVSAQGETPEGSEQTATPTDTQEGGLEAQIPDPTDEQILN